MVLASFGRFLKNRMQVVLLVIKCHLEAGLTDWYCLLHTAVSCTQQQVGSESAVTVLQEKSE